MKRIYQDLGDGRSKATAYAMCPKTGNVVKAPIKSTTTKIVKTSAVNASGNPLVGCGQTLNSMKNNLPFAVQTAETADGNGQFIRMETSAKFGTSEFLTFRFDNTSTTTQTFLLGDPNNLIALDRNLTTLSGALVVSGTWGDGSLAVPKTLWNGVAYDVHNMKLIGEVLTGTPSATDTPGTITARAKSESVFVNNNIISTASASPSNRQAKVDPFNVTRGIEKSDFQEGIRDFPEFRYQFNGLTGLLIELESMTSLTINLNLHAVGNAHGMVKVS